MKTLKNHALFLPTATQSCYTEGMEEMFKLSRRKGSAKWQVRKRWPSDVAPILKGEFNKSTGEEDRKAAQAQLPYLAAEYEKAVAEARAKLAAAPREALSNLLARIQTPVVV
jgi:ribosome-binding protein aMBF1 (putative translation factor)